MFLFTSSLILFGFFVASGFRKSDYEDLLGERLEKEREHRDLEKLFEESGQRNDDWPDEDEEDVPEDDEEYEFNGDHKSDLDEDVTEAEQAFQKNKNERKEAATGTKNAKAIIKLDIESTTLPPTTMSKPTAVPAATNGKVRAFHRHHQIRTRRFHRNPFVRSVRTFHRRNLERFRYRNDEDTSGKYQTSKVHSNIINTSNYSDSSKLYTYEEANNFQKILSFYLKIRFAMLTLLCFLFRCSFLPSPRMSILDLFKKKSPRLHL